MSSKTSKARRRKTEDDVNFKVAARTERKFEKSIWVDFTSKAQYGTMGEGDVTQIRSECTNT